MVTGWSGPRWRVTGREGTGVRADLAMAVSRTRGRNGASAAGWGRVAGSIGYSGKRRGALRLTRWCGARLPGYSWRCGGSGDYATGVRIPYRWAPTSAVLVFWRGAGLGAGGTGMCLPDGGADVGRPSLEMGASVRGESACGALLPADGRRRGADVWDRLSPRRTLGLATAGSGRAGRDTRVRAAHERESETATVASTGDLGRATRLAGVVAPVGDAVVSACRSGRERPVHPGLVRKGLRWDGRYLRVRRES